LAAKVICATPVSILKDGDIQFTPALPPSKQRALKATIMPAGFKVAIEFKEKFYFDNTYDHSFLESCFHLMAGYGYERIYFDALQGKGLPDKHVLGLYCYGWLATDLAKLDDAKLFETVMATLDKMYGGQATKNYVKHMIKNWSNEPFIKGAFQNPWYGTRMEKEFGISPLNGQVFFAGEYCAGYLAPTVHGASLTGRRAAMMAVGKEYTF